MKQRWGIAGTGLIARTMADALGTIDDAELVAVGSRTDDAARHFATSYDVPHAHGSYEALMADDEVDVVYVATPTSHHLTHSLAALRSGRHVLCEKAFTANAAEAAVLVKAAEQHDRFLMEAMWTWFLPAIEQVQQWVAEGRIGDIRVIQADFGLRVEATHRRLLDPELAGGSLLDMGIYPVALSRLLLGAPRTVAAVGKLGTTGVDTNLAAVLGHPDGAVTTFATSLEADLPKVASIVGTLGTIHLAAPFFGASSAELIIGDHRQIAERPHRGLAHQAEHVMDCIERGLDESPVLPLATSVAMMETLDQIRHSAGMG
ncbi:MAG: putative dehydrogenase [Glaciecola sp.]|jgi:predicted dehydrogenase